MFYGEGEERRLRAAFGDGPVRLWKWWWDRRHRIADWIVAVCAFPWTALFNLAPGWGLLSAGVVPFQAGGAPALLQVAVLGFLTLALPAAVSLALLVRRSRPNWLMGLALVLLLFLGNPVPGMLGLYSYASWFTDRRRLALWSALVVTAGAGASLVTDSRILVTFFFLMWGIALPLTLGLWVGTRRQLIGNLRERAERLEREQYLMADRAINAERTRIAREMHDVVAHRVSMMVLQAGGLEVNAPDDRTAEVAGLIRTTGREALGELREILGVLRDSADGSGGGAAPTAPQPVLSDLSRLVGEWRTAGMDVVWSSGGRPRPLPAQAERTAYRVVQEALTNAGRHAPGARVQVRVDYGEGDLEVAVANEPPPPRTGGAPEPPMGGGYGLAGLHERVVLAEGVLTAGPFPDGGWQVRAVLPLPHGDVPPGGEEPGQGPPDQGVGPSGGPPPGPAR
ncbi:sensor histidine kinase [Nocardiopsis suaedae]|uniref:histidine kinase n=1 Tax=Nocardiopsis suaedae TaxID=3018444 RepID=A0ABT4TJF7_9ACTN|nr:histidine kinase [Nocardiopsis suaedae]MDA2804843.1 histidine kinase [Nocardiopsis suaedae]